MRKDIIEYEGLYQADELGNVIKVSREAKDKRDGFYTKEVILKGRFNKDRHGNDSYKAITLWKDAKYKHKLVHIVIWEAFNGIEKPNGFDIDHIDGNKQNNCIDNLELVSRKENMIRAYKLGLAKTGHNNSNSKTSKEDLDKVFDLLRKNYTRMYACKLTGVSRDTLKKIAKGISYKDRTNELLEILNNQDKTSLIREPRGKHRDKVEN